jgi:hypothetical protein
MPLHRDSYSDIADFWFAVDEIGQIGAFGCKRCGRPFLLEELRAYAAALQFIESTPVEGAYRMSDNLSRFRKGMYDGFPIPTRMEKLGLYAVEANFSPLSAKGVFAYSAVFEPDRKGSTVYFRVCSPSVPILASKLPPDVRRTVQRVAFRGLRFDAAQVVDVIAGVRVE